MFKQIEDKKIGQFLYRRFEGESKALGQKNTLGILSPSLDGSFVPEQSLYFFHGGDSNDQLFVMANFLDLLSEKNKALLIERKIQLVFPNISLSYLKPPYDEHVLREVIPFAESTRMPRMLHGVSMGGTAALNLFLKNPDLFDRIAVQFGGLIAFNPFDDEESKKYQAQTGISDEKMGILRYCYQTPFKNLEDFHANDPFQLVKGCDAARLNGKRIYLDVGDRDDFGLFVGNQAFNQLLKTKGISHEMYPRKGGHDLEFMQNYLDQSFDFLLK